MKANKTTYQNVAKQCSSYNRKETGVTNCSSDSCPSCSNCNHFTTDEHCSLDLYDSIAKTL